MKISLISATSLLGFVFLVSAGPHPPHGKLGMETEMTACLKELGITMDDVRERIENGEADKEDCFGACVGKKVGFVNEEGSIDTKVVVAKYPHLPRFMPAKDLTKLIETCAEKKKDNLCETSSVFRLCIENATREAERPVRKLMEGCNAQFGLPNGHLRNFPEFKEKTKDGCWAACLIKVFELDNENGTFSVARYLEKYDANNFFPDDNKKFEEIAESCGKLTGKDACETASVIGKCLFENGVHGVFPM